MSIVGKDQVDRRLKLKYGITVTQQAKQVFNFTLKMPQKQAQPFNRLQQTHKRWQQLQSKGQLKMKMKVNKEKKQYYDFDFSRYQYYYNYPKDHFSFLLPNRQRELFEGMIKKVLQTDVELFGDKEANKPGLDAQSMDSQQCDDSQHSNSPFFDFQTDYSPALFSHLKPYELQHFLHDYINKITHKIICLRIKKSLLTPKKVKALFKDTQRKNQTQTVVQLLETQIRTYVSKLNRLEGYDFQFGKDLADRFDDTKTPLKGSTRDQMHFSPLDKTDFIVYERLIKVQHRLVYPMRCAQYEALFVLNMRYADIQRAAYLKGLESIKEIGEREKEQSEVRRGKLMTHLGEKEPFFLEEFSNLASIDAFLQSLSYLQRLSSSSAKGCLNINLHYSDVAYIPSDKRQLSQYIHTVCRQHFSASLMSQLLSPESKQSYSEEHLCYKVAKLASTIFRISQQTYDLTVTYHDRDILSKKVIMKRELETVFAQDVDKLLGLPEYEAVALVGNQYQIGYTIQAMHQAVTLRLHESQLLYQHYFEDYQFRDPFLSAFANLLFSRKQKNFHDLIQEYTSYLKQKQTYANKLTHLSLFYNHIHSDPKNHLINIINAKLSLAHQPDPNPNFTKFLNILKEHSVTPAEEVSLKLLNSLYFLRLITTQLNKNKLMSIINGQVNIMLKLKNKLNFLKRKANLKFELSQQFITRYTETNQKKDDPFDFLRHIETLDDQVSYQIPSDKLFIDKVKYEVAVKRTNPENPLFEGKKIIYQLSVKETQLLINSMIALGSKIIEKRQNYLHAEQLTHVVDRVQMLYQLMESEVKYQMSKLCLMKEYSEILEQSTSPQGIQIISHKIYKLKLEQFSMGLNQNSFHQEYQHLTSNFDHKTTILQQLKSTLTKIEHDEAVKVKNGMIRKNFNHLSPELSSIYYTEGSRVEENIEEEEESDDEKEIGLLEGAHNVNNDSDSRSEAPQNSVLETSQFSSRHSYKHSDYHVKKTFKEILSLNETSKIKSNVEKKEQLLNRKKNRVFNDTVLGKLLHYTFDDKPDKNNMLTFSEHLHSAETVMSSIQKAFETNPKYAKKSVQNAALEEIIKQNSLLQSKNMQLEDKLPEELLPLTLHECSKALSKVVQKIKTQPNAIDHSTCIDPVLMDQVLKNTTTTNQVDPYRGLYICLNHVQMQEMLYENSVTKYRQQRIKSHLVQMIASYSSLKLTKQPILLMPNVLEEYANSQFKLLTSLCKKSQLYLISLGQYNIYAKLMCLLDAVFADFYQKIYLHLVADHVDKFSSLCTQLELLSKGNVWIGDGSTNTLNQFTRIQNKVWVAKKLQTLKQYQKNLIHKQTISDLLQFPTKLISQTLPNLFRQNKLAEPHQLIDASQQFLSYLQSINLLASKVIIINYNLHEKYRLRERILALDDYLKILPHLREKIVVSREEQRVFKEVFAEELTLKKEPLKSTQDKSETPTMMNISLIKLKPSFISSIISSLASSSVSTSALFTFESLTKREYLEFKSVKEVENKRRVTTNSNHKYFSLSNPFPPPRREFMHIINSVQSLQSQQNFRVTNVLYLIQSRLLLFGCELSSEELVKFRILLQDKAQNFQVFWKDETSSLIQAKEFVRLRNFRLDANKILERYKDDYLSFANLKTKYKAMVEKLSEVNLDIELEDSIYLLVNCMYFVGLERHVKTLAQNESNKTDIFGFLYQFGNQVERPDPLKDFFHCILKEKVSIKQVLNSFSFTNYKKILWNNELLSSKFNNFREFEERNKYLRFHINNLKRKHEKDIQSDILHLRFQKFIFTNILKNADIETYTHKMSLEIFSKNFRQKAYENAIVLTHKEKQLFDLSPQNVDSKSKLELLKDEAFESIYFIQYYKKILFNKLYELSEWTLNQEVELKRLLGDSFEQRELNKDNRIINESLNKVLAPKVQLNPFLNSPLLLDNYFFAGALKLSYIDQFLNKLKNRAIMVELAEGGFGFLLKVAELDQSVNALCKGIISFSQKQFNDRLRTYFEYTNQLEDLLKTTKKENEHLRLLNKLHSFYDEKQIKALVYEKLHSYIQFITEKQKNYNHLFAVFKNMENTVMKMCSQKYQNQINQLEKEKFVLKQTFKGFSQKIKHSALSSVNESRDKLYHEFKEKTQKILSKDFIPEYDQLEKPSFEQTEAYESEILLKKLKEKSIVSKLRSTAITAQYEKKIQQLESKLQEKQKIIRNLTQERQKNLHLMHEVNFLANKAIQVQALQKQRKIDQEERMMEKFKLIRINQSLQGKLSRIENPKGKDQSSRENIQREFPIERDSSMGRESGGNRQTVMERDRGMKSEAKISKQSHLKTEQSLFITQEPKKRSHTQFDMPTTKNHQFQVNTSLRSRIKKKRSVLSRPQQAQLPLHKQYQISKMQNIDEGRIWREKWEKSESKYQKVVEKVKFLGENYKLTKNGKKIGEKLVELMQEVTCEPKGAK